MAGFGVGTSNQTFVVKQELRVPLTISVIFYKSLSCVLNFPEILATGTFTPA